MRRLRQPGFRAPLYLVVVIALGVVTNVGVCFAIAIGYYRLPRSATSVTISSGYVDFAEESFTRKWTSVENYFDIDVRTEARPKAERSEPAQSAIAPTRPPRWVAIWEVWKDIPPTNQLGYPDLQFADVAIGFPFKAMAVRVRGTPPGMTANAVPSNFLPAMTESGLRLDETVVAGIYIGHELREIFPKLFKEVVGLKALPSRILWPGTIGNVIVYSGLFWVAGLGIASFRRGVARRENCPACGYSRQGLTKSTRCPECGRVAEVLFKSEAQ